MLIAIDCCGLLSMDPMRLRTHKENPSSCNSLDSAKGFYAGGPGHSSEALLQPAPGPRPLRRAGNTCMMGDGGVRRRGLLGCYYCCIDRCGNMQVAREQDHYWCPFGPGCPSWQLLPSSKPKRHQRWSCFLATRACFRSGPCKSKTNPIARATDCLHNSNSYISIAIYQ